MSIQLASKYSGTQPYHVYYNMDLLNNNTTTTAIPVNFTYTEVRNSPFLGSPENYFMSVVRFNVQTPTLPIFIPQILLGQADTNKTAYSITFEWTATTTNVYTAQTFVQYVSFDTTQTQPVAVGGSLSVNDLTNPYYYIFSYTQWVNMVNTALATGYAALQTAINAGAVAADIAQWNALAGVVLPAQDNKVPFMEFNPIDLTANYNANVTTFSVLQSGATATTGSGVKTYFNSALYSLYSSFQYKSFGYKTPTIGRNFQLITFNNSGTNLYSVPASGAVAAYTAIQVYQECQTAALLNPVSAIVFTTALIPISPENIGVPKLFNSSGLSSSGGLANVAPIITDFVVPFSAMNTYRPDINYTPSGEYRLCDLYGSTPLQGIEISVFWKDTYGQNHPLELGSGSAANLKIMFRRKDYNTTKLFNSI